jgi:hypothetical protein
MGKDHAGTVASHLADLNDDCLRAVELRLPLAAAAAFRTLCKQTAGLVSPVRDELEWARRVAISEFDPQAAARLAELKGMPRAAAHFGRAPLTIETLEVAAQLLSGEPVTGSAQLHSDISTAGGEHLLAECILTDRGWARMPRALLSHNSARMVGEMFDPHCQPDSCLYHLGVTIACCCDANTLSSLYDLGSTYFDYVLSQLLDQPIPASDALLLLEGLQLAREDILETIARNLLEHGMGHRLVAWVMNEATAGAAVGLLCSLVGANLEIWLMASHAGPTILARVCALTRDCDARTPAFSLLRLVSYQSLIDVDTPIDDHLPTALRAVPFALAAAAEGAAEAQSEDEVRRSTFGPPGLSSADGLAWSCLGFLNMLQNENPGLLCGETAVLRAVAASASAHTNPDVTELAYDFLDWALQCWSGIRPTDVKAALPGMMRDLAHQPSRNKRAAVRVFVGIIKLSPNSQQIIDKIHQKAAAKRALRATPDS